eukprot:gene8628-8809_t
MTVKDGIDTNGVAASAKPVTLVSFDVDGTLIHSIGKDANKLHKDCFSAAFKEVFGLDTHIDVVPHHGGTDPLIAIKVLEHCGIPKAEAQSKLKDVEAAMVRYFQAHAGQAGDGLELLPGVQRLLKVLQARGDVATCLVTGNLEPIGWGKMKALGIDHLFTKPLFGGFGSDFCSGNTTEMWKDRCEFVRLAGQRARQQFAGGVRACFHVGDTPMDVQAALGAGNVAVGVCTGVFTRGQLESSGVGAAAGSVVVLDGLEDVDTVLKALRLDQ